LCIYDKRIEPYHSHVAAQSLKLMSAQLPRRYRTVLHWRPLVLGLNDSDEHLDRAFRLSRHADATVFTGLSTATRSLTTIAQTAWQNHMTGPRGGRSFPRRSSGACCRLRGLGLIVLQDLMRRVVRAHGPAGLQRELRH
jgi:hypothetical protein